jgi:hypothetical protein
VPPPFHVRVVHLFRLEGELRGVVGRITEPSFLYDELSLVGTTRLVGIWNFTDRPAVYNLEVWSEAPTEGDLEDRSEHANLGSMGFLRGHPHAYGFGQIAESAEAEPRHEPRPEQPIPVADPARRVGRKR